MVTIVQPFSSYLPSIENKHQNEGLVHVYFTCLQKIQTLPPNVRNPLMVGAFFYFMPKLINLTFPKQEDHYPASKIRTSARKGFSNVVEYTFNKSYSSLGKVFSFIFPPGCELSHFKRADMPPESLPQEKWRGEVLERLYLLRMSIRDVFEAIKENNKSKTIKIFKVIIPYNFYIMSAFMSHAIESFRMNFKHPLSLTAYEFTLLSMYGFSIGVAADYVRQVLALPPYSSSSMD